VSAFAAVAASSADWQVLGELVVVWSPLSKPTCGWPSVSRMMPCATRCGRSGPGTTAPSGWEWSGSCRWRRPRCTRSTCRGSARLDDARHGVVPAVPLMAGAGRAESVPLKPSGTQTPTFEALGTHGATPSIVSPLCECPPALLSWALVTVQV